MVYMIIQLQIKLQLFTKIYDSRDKKKNLYSPYIKK